jgi:hypothetical protein
LTVEKRTVAQANSEVDFGVGQGGDEPDAGEHVNSYPHELINHRARLNGRLWRQHRDVGRYKEYPVS